jgi:hypothetical protein
LLEEGSEVAAANEDLDEPEDAGLVLAEVDDGNDVGVGETAAHLRLEEEHLPQAGVVLPGMDDL